MFSKQGENGNASTVFGNVHTAADEVSTGWKVSPDTFFTRNCLKRFSHDLEITTRQQYRNNQRTEIERFDWFIERIQTRVAFGWLSERSGEKTSCPENFLEINRYFALTSYCNTIGQSNNAFSILGFLWRKNEEAMFWSFHPLADKTNNEQIPKPFERLSGKIFVRFRWSRVNGKPKRTNFRKRAKFVQCRVNVALIRLSNWQCIVEASVNISQVWEDVRHFLAQRERFCCYGKVHLISVLVVK